MQQTLLYEVPNPQCPYKEFLDPTDAHCNDLGFGQKDYPVIDENHPDHDTWLAVIRGVGFNDVVAQPLKLPELPAYIPNVRKHSPVLFQDYSPPWVGVLLGDIISPKNLEVATDLYQRTGAPPGTKFVLFGYGFDDLIERIWPIKEEIFGKIARLNFSLVTGINYSIWGTQPHFERLMNMKRSLLTFEGLQKLGLPAVPHIYWHSRVDLRRWADWLRLNECVRAVAINLQTIPESMWLQTVADIHYLVEKCRSDLHFIITGPEAKTKILQLKAILPSFTLSNGFASRKASCNMLLVPNGLRREEIYSPNRQSLNFANNVRVFEEASI